MGFARSHISTPFSPAGKQGIGIPVGVRHRRSQLVVAATEVNQRGFALLTLDVLDSPNYNHMISAFVLSVGTAFQNGERRQYNGCSRDSRFVRNVLPFIRQGLVKPNRKILLILLQKIDGE